MKPYPRDILCQLLTEHGTTLCSQPKRLVAFLKDFCADHRRENFVLIQAIHERIVADLPDTLQGIPLAVLIRRSVRDWRNP